MVDQEAGSALTCGLTLAFLVVTRPKTATQISDIESTGGTLLTHLIQWEILEGFKISGAFSIVFQLTAVLSNGLTRPVALT